MKVTIEIDCTPLEARQFFGLPDVQPMQAALLAQMEKRLMVEAEKFTPEGLMQAWFSGGTQGAEWFRGMVGGLFHSPEAVKRAPIPPSAPISPRKIRSFSDPARAPGSRAGRLVSWEDPAADGNRIEREAVRPVGALRARRRGAL